MYCIDLEADIYWLSIMLFFSVNDHQSSPLVPRTLKDVSLFWAPPLSPRQTLRSLPSSSHTAYKYYDRSYLIQFVWST